MRAKLLIVMVACLFVLGAVIAYESVQAQMKPTGKGGGTRVMNTHEQIEKLVRDFLIGAGNNDVAEHERFWADDLIYTSAAGVVRTKAEILKNVREAAAKPDAKEPKTTFDAEDMTIHDFGNFAIVNFRLVAHDENNGKPETRYFRNTGTLHRINNEWKVIAWQATRIEGTKHEEAPHEEKK
jgi:ketosteroid isomerase-like protein